MSEKIQPLSPDVMPDPSKDGVDHINVYSRGRTQLGQALSNFSHFGFQHPEYGFFASVEAFWYWASTGMQHDDLRRLYGTTAKSAGLRKPLVRMDESIFHEMIGDAIRLKIAQNRSLAKNLCESELPFRHYFVYGSNPPVVREKADHRWQMELLESLRADLKAGRPIQLADHRRADSIQLVEVAENPTPDEMEHPPLDKE